MLLKITTDTQYDCANEVRDNAEIELEELSNRVDELEDEDDG